MALQIQTSLISYTLFSLSWFSLFCGSAVSVFLHLVVCKLLWQCWSQEQVSIRWLPFISELFLTLQLCLAPQINFCFFMLLLASRLPAGWYQDSASSASVPVGKTPGGCSCTAGPWYGLIFSHFKVLFLTAVLCWPQDTWKLIIAGCYFRHFHWKYYTHCTFCWHLSLKAYTTTVLLA